jgi:hypothetical protein
MRWRILPRKRVTVAIWELEELTVWTRTMVTWSHIDVKFRVELMWHMHLIYAVCAWNRPLLQSLEFLNYISICPGPAWVASDRRKRSMLQYLKLGEGICKKARVKTRNSIQSLEVDHWAGDKMHSYPTGYFYLNSFQGCVSSTHFPGKEELTVKKLGQINEWLKSWKDRSL